MDKEEKQRRRLRRIVRAAAWSLGLGVGLWLVRLIAPLFLSPDAVANQAFLIFGTVMVFYGGALLLAVLFIRKQAGIVALILNWVVMPLVVVKIIMDIMS